MPQTRHTPLSRAHQRRVGLKALALLALAGICGTAAAQADYPNKPVRVIVPFAVGGPADIYARFIAQRLGDALKQSFVVDNRPGAGAVIGTDAAAKSPADGYTLLLMSNTHTVNESLIPNKPYQLMRDFVGVAPINYSDLVLVGKPNLSTASVGEIVAASKAKPAGMTYASSGPGTPYHMAGELFKAMAGVDIVHVPYKGSSGARTDVLGGQVDMMFDAIPTMAEQIKAGKVKGIATTGKSRSPILPELPTVHEAGVKDYEATIWLGLMAPKGTPQAVVDKLNAEVSKITASTETRSAWTRQGATAMSMNPAEFNRYLNDDIAKWANVVKVTGAKVD
jgi:tripartite-type tricarboxylate transporter receptor subunit TctC